MSPLIFCHQVSNVPRIFYINLPLGIPALAGIYFFINLESEPLSVKERLLRVDWTGIVILTGSLISLLYGVTSGGVLHPWKSAQVIVSIVVGAFGVTVFLFYEGKYAKEPMIPLRILVNRTAAAAYVSSFILGFVLWAMQYYLILYVSPHLPVDIFRTLTWNGIVSRNPTPFTPRSRRRHSSGNSIRPSNSNRWRSDNLKTTEIPNSELDFMATRYHRFLVDDSIENRF